MKLTITIGEEIFARNARAVLRDIGMPDLDPAHGAAVDIVRLCLLLRQRPTHHRQVFLEKESPALLAYLETLASRGEPEGWRTLEKRIGLHAEALRETEMYPCKRPWLAAIWHALPELAALGQAILDRDAALAPEPAPSPAVRRTGGGADGAGDKGSAGKAGSSSSLRPKPSRRLSLPRVSAMPTVAEKRALDLGDDSATADTTDGPIPGGADGPDGPDGTGGPKGPGGMGGPK